LAAFWVSACGVGLGDGGAGSGAGPSPFGFSVRFWASISSAERPRMNG